MLDLKRLRVLNEVARQGSFSAAAAALSFTQSAVSQQVAALEREAGAQLVDRGGRGIRLTEAGAALVTHAEAVLARLEDAEDELAAIAGLRGGRLRFGSFPSAGNTLVPHAVAEFRSRHPGVELGMAETEPEEALPQLHAGAIDLAIVYEYDNAPEKRDEAVELCELMRDPVAVVLPKDHPLAARPRVRMGDLRDEDWVGACVGNGCRRMVIHACNDAGFDPTFGFETDDHHTAQAFVATGVGVTLLPHLALSAIHPGVAVRPLASKAPYRTISAATLRGSYRSPATEAMLGILSDVSAKFTAAARAA